MMRGMFTKSMAMKNRRATKLIDRKRNFRGQNFKDGPSKLWLWPLQLEEIEIKTVR